MLEYVWDYGFLKPEEERAYIKLMLQNKIVVLKKINKDQKFIDLFTDLIARSHLFIRNEFKGDNFVSLRDVNRTITLFNWFPTFVEILNPDAFDHIKESVILALSLSYHARLPA